MTRALSAIDHKSKYMLLAIDPSVRNLGWAKFLVNEFAPRECKLVETGLIKARCENWLDGLNHMQYQIEHDVLTPDVISKAIIEQPIVFGGGGGRGEAAQNTGAVIKLTACAFSLRTQMSMGAWGIDVTMVPVNRWKGTVPKEITRRRMMRWWKIDADLNHNIVDAVGIGDWYIRKYLRLLADG